MAVPEVDKKLLEELEAMGFPLARATRAIHYSGNSTIENAVSWIIDHENDPDIDQMPLIPVDIDLDVPKPFDLTEEVKIKAKELRNGAFKLRKEKEKEKETEREREKERIRAGKELQEAKRIAEENARKRMIALRRAEKEEERKARVRIRQKLEADKAERRPRLGMPLQPAIFSIVRPAARTVHENSISAPLTSTEKAELLSNCLRSLRCNHKDDDARVKRAFQTLLIYIRNVIRNPDVEKYRWIRLTNPVFQERVGSLTRGVRFLELCGFETTNRGQFLYLPREKVDMETLSSAISVLHSAITNPFFGLFSVELD